MSPRLCSADRRRSRARARARLAVLASIPVHRAPAGRANNNDSDCSDIDMDVPTAQKREIIMCVDSGATDAFVIPGTPLKNVRQRSGGG
jgi:hypothetical protein